MSLYSKGFLLIFLRPNCLPSLKIFPSLILWDASKSREKFSRASSFGKSYKLIYVTNRNQNTSKQIRKLISSRRILKAFRFWSENHRRENRLLLHSIIGQIFLVSLFLFLQALDIRSSILSGIILGMMLHILADQALDLGRRKHLRDWVFWPVREKIPEGTAVASFIIFSLIFAFSSWLIIK